MITSSNECTKISYNWFTILKEKKNIKQGDIIFKCPVFRPILDETLFKKRKSQLPLKYTKSIFNLIILTQTCDIRWKNVNYLIVCPFFPLTQVIKTLTYKDSDADENELKEFIRTGNFPSYFMLSSFQEGGLDEEQVVNFKQVFTLKRDFIDIAHSKQSIRIRLLPPYREALAQSFGRFFMRVGYPIDISSFPRQ
ncbi:MAG: hypothetical protein ACXAEU_16010 [Candidatus Hodarchaeales archaeon]|jgi:hypothetical protein